jgi:twitching motility protein PilT
MNMDIFNILEKAINKRASDVHFTVQSVPQFRIDGELISIDEYPVLKNEDIEYLIKQILNPVQQEFLDQKGDIDLSASRDRVGRFRVNVYKQRGSYCAAFRIISGVIPTLEELGLPASIKPLTRLSKGLVLVTGPTGSGKSTTLASMIDVINSERRAHILTLEDPIEFLHKHKKAVVNQREVGNDTESYQTGLRSALRQDPDIILVGEMRDLETISIALTAAETGHLVFSTLHTQGAAKTIDRIVDVFPPHQQGQVRVQLSGVIQAIISQRLIPKRDQLGRVAAFEVLLANPAIRNLIRENKSYQINTVIQTGSKVGMISMDQSLISLFRRGLISRDNALLYAVDVNNVTKQL